MTSCVCNVGFEGDITSADSTCKPILVCAADSFRDGDECVSCPSGSSSSQRESSPGAQGFTPEQWLRNVRSKKPSELETLRGEAQCGIITDTMMHLQNHPGDGELISAYLRRLKRGHDLESNKSKNLHAPFTRAGQY